MKKIFKLLMLALFFSAYIACDEYEHMPVSSDREKPSIIENIQYSAINGGVDITYDIPNDKDLLYVKAVYTNTLGEESEVKTSIFDNKIQVLGFGDTSEKKISLYAVDRSNNVSEPVSIMVTPLASPLSLIQPSLSIIADYGGARFTWENETNTPIAIELMVKNNRGKMEILETVYTEAKSSQQALRDLESVPTLFAALIKDNYGNVSDTIFANTPDKLLTPLFEEKLDKNLFLPVYLDNDDNWNAWGDYFGIFDDNPTTMGHTGGSGLGTGTNIFTVDLGVNVSLSRIRLNSRLRKTQEIYGRGAPKQYKLYGAKTLPGTDGNLDDWTFLRTCDTWKPSGLPLGSLSDEDVIQYTAGFEFIFDLPVEIRYFRIVVTETWDNAAFCNITEMNVWGSIFD
ncbi:DUF4959 domain-containing protein [Thalassobellus suaedae]|uniref:DUF4959 domain-containing protein n=1 Tax=Thalassobellus suaedae TaxID=3074124 RepID=A0ABY9XR41_9FLAO|nr:DUF4959 domain-containing protein [Flavobacteriaceae bacterium HL-DH14]WNH13720.1 DUF4959 domain-containing protein [Flavobacteriaceae bacterium HL-DH10]